MMTVSGLNVSSAVALVFDGAPHFFRPPASVLPLALTLTCALE